MKTEKRWRAKKSLGQHFLVAPDIVQKIISYARFQDSDLVLEIGPGRGALTIPLAESVGHVVAVEKDSRLTKDLQDRLVRECIDNVTLFNEDILRWAFARMKSRTSDKFMVIGNLPYNISSPFLEKLIENRRMIKRAILMFQAEVARRLSASPGSKTYGAMTLLTQYHASITNLLSVSRKAFRPRPQVDSIVIEIDFDRPYPIQTPNEDFFRKIVKGAFAHRRKTIINSLKVAYPSWESGLVAQAMEECGIDPGRRAETLHMEEFLALTSALAFIEGG
ncbi:MAG: 16S rRNA (adenine(1518)-N(6)/adenine(1519)-N(6))-dimethyltransferase RsmA [Desulfatiglans sp.]|jgi:16S rRNA (adenine1518-N6/adenine1519-N6)-dimethyltransferase|nr:16S rRNA (adenine(1518)-N(6)/adenine(1519)-N(6))-dimethyltransferase RsmA [Thermodesulfobacteriota bacterium]MEE4353271.1 16S rRNA (adenine(1518)-N(6)/adenine(1519)-N(6))-dimethyltransferase RsmA [Desulfatiglans sp.]